VEVPERSRDAVGEWKVIGATDTEHPSDRGTHDEPPVDATGGATQVDSAECGQSRCAEEVHRAGVDDEDVCDGSMTFHVSGHVPGIACIDLPAEPDDKRMLRRSRVDVCPAPLLAHADARRIWAIETARSDEWHRDLLWTTSTPLEQGTTESAVHSRDSQIAVKPYAAVKYVV